jgi:hypothetical protein
MKLNFVSVYAEHRAESSKPVRPSNCFWCSSKAPVSKTYFAGSLSNEIAVAREVEMTRSSPAFS